MSLKFALRDIIYSTINNDMIFSHIAMEKAKNHVSKRQRLSGMYIVIN
jgi:hypothetical protein